MVLAVFTYTREVIIPQNIAMKEGAVGMQGSSNDGLPERPEMVTERRIA